MARLRVIKPEFWCSPDVVKCSRDARLLFIGLWNHCDDAGCAPASPLRLKMEVFPADNCSEHEIMIWINELLASGLLIEYEICGKKYWHVTGWKHQKIARPHYKYPPPPTLFVKNKVEIHCSDTAHALNEQCSSNDQAVIEHCPSTHIYIEI